MTGFSRQAGPDAAAPLHGPFRHRVLRNAAAGLGANIWAIVVALVTLPLMVHGLGVANFGRWVLLQTMSASTGWLSVLDGGLAVASTRLVSMRAATGTGGGTGAAVGTTMVIFTVIAALGAGITLGAAWPVLRALGRIPNGEIHAAHAASLLLAVQVAGEFVEQGAESCLEGLQRLDLSRAVDAVRRAMFAGATAAVALGGGSLRAVEGAAGAASVLGAALAAGTLFAQRVPALSLAAGDLRQMVGYAVKVALLRPISAVYRLMDRIIVGAVLGPVAVSAVEVATQLQNGSDAVVTGATAALVPSSAWVDARGGRYRLSETLVAGTRYALVASWPLAAGIGMLATPGIRLWAGARLATTAAGPAQVAMAASAVAATAQVASNVLLGAGRGVVILRAAIVGVTVDLVASITLVHPLGVAGVFWGTLAAVGVTTPWIIVAACRHCGTDRRMFFTRSVFPALPPVLAELAVLGIVDALGLRPSVTLAVGVPLGTAVVAAATLRWTLPVSEIARLWRTLRGNGSESGPSAGAPSGGPGLL